MLTAQSVRALEPLVMQVIGVSDGVPARATAHQAASALRFTGITACKRWSRASGSLP